MNKKYILVEFNFDNEGTAWDYIPSGTIFAYSEEQARKELLIEMGTHLNILLENKNYLSTALEKYDDYVGKDVIIDSNSQEEKFVGLMYSASTLYGKYKFSKISYEAKHMIPKEKIEKCYADEIERFDKLLKLIEEVKLGKHEITKINTLAYCAAGINLRKAVAVVDFEEE